MLGLAYQIQLASYNAGYRNGYNDGKRADQCHPTIVRRSFCQWLSSMPLGYWRRTNDQLVPIAHISDRHLLNCLNSLKRRSDYFRIELVLPDIGRVLCRIEWAARVFADIDYLALRPYKIHRQVNNCMRGYHDDERDPPAEDCREALRRLITRGVCPARAVA